MNFATKTTVLGIFDLRSFLNLGMLLVKSEKAKKLRAMILDVVIATINAKTGGGTQFINWRDRDFLPAAIKEEDYHKKFTSAIFPRLRLAYSCRQYRQSPLRPNC